MKLDVCLETVFPELSVEERIAKIAEAGYDCVEMWFPDGRDSAAIRQACAQHGVTVNDLVVNGPDGGLGGAPVDAGDLSKYLERVEEMIAFAKGIDCHKGITCTGNLQPGLTRVQMRANLENALGQAAAIAEKHQFTLVLEALNTHVDHAGYYLDSSLEGAEIVRAINSSNLKLLYDVYHMQIMEGNLISNIEKNIDVIGHFHSAGVPGRGELFGSEINYPEVLKRIEATGYTGCFGLEYFPKMTDHLASLKQNRAYLLSAFSTLA
ncbi:MAG: hydroxypyruvate isomerase family protein [Armatimonadota bacterium]